MSILSYSKTVRAIDNDKTAANAKAYRRSKRVRLHEVAKILMSPHGTQMTKSNLSHYESGKQQWTPEFAEAYVNAVNETAASFAAK
jgi:transcriptional regulator with XRE-family HTH domain